MVFTRAMSLRSPRIFFRLSVCPMFSWNFSLNSWSASSRSWVAKLFVGQVSNFVYFHKCQSLTGCLSARSSRFTNVVRKRQLVRRQAHCLGRICRD